MEIAVSPQRDELIATLPAGDTLGYKELYARYSKAMYNTCLRMLNNAAEAEDVLQESFIEAFKNLDRFEYRTSFGGWLKQICINRSINQLKKRRIDWVNMEQIAGYDSADEQPLDEVEITMQVESVKRAIMKLPDGYRTVLNLYLLEGYDHEEISEILHVAESTTRTQYMRAKQKLLTNFKRRIMSNKLKKFIWDNRKEFDNESPSEKVWDNIEASFTKKKKKKSFIRPLYKWSMAAAAMLVICSGVYLMINNKPDEPSAVVETKPEINNLPPEYASQMNQFVKMIDTKQEELKMLAKEQPELYKKFTSAINQLDSSYNTLKNQLSATPNREMLLEAMIQNLQLQLNVLNQQLNIIHQIKEQKKYSHEKIDQTI